MSSLFRLPLDVDASVDFYALVSCVGQDYVPISVGQGVTATLQIFGSPLDPSPLITVSTTPGSNGALLFGVGLPDPAGTACATESAIAEHGFPGSVTTTPPLANQGSVANAAALTALVTTSFQEGDVVFVTASPGLFYAWSPLDTRYSPDGKTVIQGNAGTGLWLLCGTVLVQLTAAALEALAGFDHATYNLVVAWTDETKTKLLSRDVFVQQAEM
jgi:hypothetical protein